MCARCTRIWCVRPVSSVTRSRLCARKPLDEAIVRDGLAPIGAHRHAQAVRAMPADGLVDGAARRSGRRHTARGIRAASRVRAAASVRAVCASSVRATTSRPLVSLSMRCTMPARGMAASFGSSASSAFCSVCARLPAPGCTTSPAGLSITKNCGSRSATLSAMDSRLHLGGRARSARTPTASPPYTASRGRAARAVDGDGAGPDPARPAASGNTAAMRRPGPGQGAGPPGSRGGPACARLSSVVLRCLALPVIRLY